MAEVEQGIYARLTGQTGVTNLVGTRIYSGIAPLNASFPYLVYLKTSAPGIHAMKADPSLARPHIQILSWSTSYSQIKSIALQVRTALRDFSGSTGGISFQRIFFNNEGDLVEVDPKTMRVRYQVTQDYTVWHS